MKNVTSIISVLVLLLTGCNDTTIMHPDQLKNTVIVNKEYWTNDIEKISFYNMSDSTFNKCLMYRSLSNNINVLDTIK